VNALVPKNRDHVIGVLSGWDRLVFRGTLRMLAFAGGMAAYLSRIGVLLKDFGDHAQAMTEKLIQASLQRAEAAGRPVQYLHSPSLRKDDYARRIYENHEGQIVSEYRHRPEGVCVKHRALGNSIKVYDKAGSLLRIETTINNPQAYRSYRASETEPEGGKQWRVMRRGVADMYRRAEVSQAANDRYAEALASLDTTTPLGRLAAMVCRPASKDGKRYRALHPFSAEDHALLEAISDGKYAAGGFCNRDLASRLYPATSADPIERAQTASKVSYRLRILRSHGLIRKLPGQRRYHMTTKGRQIITALLQVQHATLQQLNTLAA
jgi:hypothetical protein